MTKKANDYMVGGDHYLNTTCQPWDFIIANNLPYLEGCVIKYVSRHRKKGGLQDLRKALHYLEKLIETESARELREVMVGNKHELEEASIKKLAATPSSSSGSD